MTSWPLSEAQTTNEQANPPRPGSRRPNAAQPGPEHANPVHSGSSQPNLGPATSGLSYQAQPTGHNQGNLRKNSSTRANPPGPPVTAPSVAARTGGYLAIVSRRGARHVPTHSGLLRRRQMINASKFLLPAAAALLLLSIALWPEFNTVTDRARFSFRGLSATMDGARLTDASMSAAGPSPSRRRPQPNATRSESTLPCRMPT